MRARKNKDGSVTVRPTKAFLKKHAEVLGTCSCGKPAQISMFEGGKFVNICFDCSEKLS